VDTEKALLAAIWAAPHDDLPRLVYADWLDESGDPAKAARAEFIRVQCELARMGDDRGSRWMTLKDVETRLWREHGRKVYGEVANKLMNEPFRRGFVAPQRRMIVLDHFLNWSEEKVNRAVLWQFNLNNFGPRTRIVELTDNPRLRRLGFLGLWGMTDEQAAAVAESPHAVNLEGIHCRHGVMTASGVRALSQSPHLPHLTELILDTGTRVDVRFAQELCRSPLAERLKRLTFKGCDRIDPVARCLLAEKFPQQLMIPDRLT